MITKFEDWLNKTTRATAEMMSDMDDKGKPWQDYEHDARRFLLAKWALKRQQVEVVNEGLDNYIAEDDEDV